jgi:RNA polymerase sigma-70 factor (ECF subfamily)
MEYAGEAVMRADLRGAGGAAGGWPEAAFEAVFFEHYARMVAVLCRILGDRAQAEEVAADTFLKLYQQPSSPDGYHNLGGWLYRTASRMAIDALRTAGRRRHYEPDAAQRLASASQPASPLEGMLSAERAANVRAALARLKPAQAQILALRANGLAYKELAGALGVKTGSVGQLLARAEAAFEKAYRKVEKGSRRGLFSRLH